MPHSEPDTEELLDRAERGDPSAVRSLLGRHRDRLRRMVALRMDVRLAARFDPSDVVQEALADGFQKLPEYLRTRPIPFYPWLRQIAWERMVDLHRRHLRSRRSIEREAEWPVSTRSVAVLADRLVATGTSPSRRLERDELQVRVRLALEQLPSGDKEILLMRHVEQLRGSEIAAALGINERAAKSRLRRALERLQLVLGDTSEERS